MKEFKKCKWCYKILNDKEVYGCSHPNGPLMCLGSVLCEHFQLKWYWKIWSWL